MIKKYFMSILEELRTYMLFPALKRINAGVSRGIKQQYIYNKLSHHLLRRKYKKNDKIDISFIFQSASFWPSWESFWNACVEDERFNPVMYVCDDEFKEKVQFKTAQTFLKNLEIPFQHISDVNLQELKPHVVVLHTPYDGHRPPYLSGGAISSEGFRLIYIPYGIEISDSNKARSDHFECGVTTNAWRIYTFSPEIIKDYKRYSPTGGDMVRAYGHPKFDLLNKVNFPNLPNEIKNKTNGRKVVLWKVHFPKKVDGKFITPSLKMYMNLLDSLREYKDLFFIFMPHPKFYAELEKFTNVEKFKSKLNLENIFEYTADDYRPVLVNSDYFILDRSALMVEAGVTGRPILYVSNDSYYEPMTLPVQRIVDSYYQANTLKEIKSFIDTVVIDDHDSLKESREEAFNNTIPKINGMSGNRIKEDIANALEAEILDH